MHTQTHACLLVNGVVCCTRDLKTENTQGQREKEKGRPARSELVSLCSLHILDAANF
jgi:hypothetical protein